MCIYLLVTGSIPVTEINSVLVSSLYLLNWVTIFIGYTIKTFEQMFFHSFHLLGKAIFREGCYNTPLYLLSINIIYKLINL